MSLKTVRVSGTWGVTEAEWLAMPSILVTCNEACCWPLCGIGAGLLEKKNSYLLAAGMENHIVLTNLRQKGVDPGNPLKSVCVRQARRTTSC